MDERLSGTPVRIIRAKVAQITSDYDIAINAGSNQGVTRNSLARLFRDVDIKDPDTNEHLGSVRYVRVMLKVSSVADKYSIARLHDPEAAPAWGAPPEKKRFTDDEFADEIDFVFINRGEACEIVVRTDGKEEPPF
ncbi:hypothetical protein KMZ32_10315 [Phycicoccus sp. MAQZ13P-2]|uniref:hypothetical protein n=1 Tax=Phycicoccus mangrovi TaxID=2840470 RepID=UPI001BFFE602|nr:hypothetical protein [Phycicoccus mangrovi]MBT9255867.1 hypothetical protein [Phycicoccus mangrovi]MBT9274461.1 hypothetical protein [Phycicoccus mangrovi]